MTRRGLGGAATAALAGILMAMLIGTTGCGVGVTYARSAVIDVDEPRALSDEPVHIRISGLTPGQQVTVAVERQHRWHSKAAFVADEHGTVDLKRDRPLRGSYTRPDPMGLFWSLRTTKKAPAGFTMPPPEKLGSYGIGLTVSWGEQEIARRTITRVRMSGRVRHRALTVADDAVNGDLYLPPKGARKTAPVLVFGGSEGGNSVRADASLLASRGHPALALCYFGCPGRPDGLEEIDLEYFATAAELLARQDTADPRHLVVMGSSRGSEAAQLLGQNYPQLVEDVVAFASSNRVYGAFPGGEHAWTMDGKPFPIGKQIPLDHVRGRVLGVVGEQDGLWPAEELSEPIAESHELLVHPYAGHSVSGPPYGPEGETTFTHPVTGGELRLGGSRAANAAAKVRTWPQVLELIEN